MQKNFFEKHSKLVLLVINSIFIALLIFVLKLDIFQDTPTSEKYSVIDRVNYQVRCEGKRHIRLRENKPNQDTFRVPPYDPSQKYRVRTDADGFIEPSKIHEKADLNIFFMGGSTTECETVDEFNRFPYLVGRIIEKKTGKKINSYNAGKSGNDSLHTINNLVNKVVPLKPDIIVRMDNINDLSTLLYEASYWNKNKTRSHLGCFSKDYSSFRNASNEWSDSPFVNMILDSNHQALIKQEHRKVLKMFIAIVRGIGATPVIMTQANRIENDPNFSTGHGDAEFNRVYRQLYLDFHALTRQVAKEEKVLLIDLATKVKGSEEFIYDAIHLNNEGSKLVAEIVAKELEAIVKNKR